MKKKFIAKLVLIGDPAVGKTSLKRMLVEQTFRSDSPTTLGADVTRITMDVSKDYEIVLQIWDIAGQSKFREVTNAYYQGAKGAIVVFDVTREETFMNVPKWIETLYTNAAPDVPLILVANKIDLEDQRVVERERAEHYAETLSDWLGFTVPTAFTSAKTGENVETSFLTIAGQMLQRALKTSR